MLIILPCLLLSLLSRVHGLAVKQHEFLLVTPGPNPTFFDGCETKYLGTYNSRESLSIYAITETCHSFDSLQSGAIVSTGGIPPRSSMVWVEEVVAEGGLRDEEPSFLEALDSFIQSENTELSDEGQIVLGSQRRPEIQVLWSSRHSAILSVRTEHLTSLDFALPRLWEAVVLPTAPLPPPRVAESDSDRRLGEILAQLHFNPDVASILSSISLAQMSFDIRWLTGESSDSPVISRHSFSDGARTAADWLKAKFQDFGAKCSYMEFLDGFAPNVICKYSAEPGVGAETATGNITTPRVILSAHYDSRGSFGR